MSNRTPSTKTIEQWHVIKGVSYLDYSNFLFTFVTIMDKEVQKHISLDRHNSAKNNS